MIPLLGFRGCGLKVAERGALPAATAFDAGAPLPAHLQAPSSLLDTALEASTLAAIAAAAEKDRSAAQALAAVRESAAAAAAERARQQAKKDEEEKEERERRAKAKEEEEKRADDEKKAAAARKESSDIEAMVRRQQAELARITAKRTASPPVPSPPQKQPQTQPQPPAKEALLAGLLEMGFSADAATAAVEVYGTDDHVFAFASAFMALAEMRFPPALLRRPLVLFDCDVGRCAEFLRHYAGLLDTSDAALVTPDDVSHALQSTGDDPRAATRQLEAVRQLRQMGFKTDQIRTAIARHGPEKALEHLLNDAR